MMLVGGLLLQPACVADIPEQQLVGEGHIEDLLELLLLGVRRHRLGGFLVEEGWSLESVIALINPILVLLAHDHDHLLGVVLQEV